MRTEAHGGFILEEHEQQKPLDLNSKEDAGVQCPGSAVHSMMSVPRGGNGDFPWNSSAICEL